MQEEPIDLNATQQATDPVPLVVDVDGTLLRADISAEHLLRCVAEAPLLFPQALRAAWLDGRSGLKSWLVEHVPMDPTLLPPNPDVLALVDRCRAERRPIILASASDQRLVEALNPEYGPFDAILGSSKSINLSGAQKASALEARYGRAGFDYVGDSLVDGPVWEKARCAIVVGGTATLERRVAAQGNLHQVIARPARGAAILCALRPHQWLKNLLVFAPMIAGHQLDVASLAVGLAVFVAFSLTASAGYIVNDLLDLPNDRQHPTKSKRPFATGLVSIHEGLITVAFLLVAAGLIAATVSTAVLGILTAYLSVTLAYSLVLKRLMMVDVMVLSLLYMMRMLAGGIAVGVTISDWLLAFSQLLFLSLAIIKRLVELADLRKRQSTDDCEVPGRGYVTYDLVAMGQLAAASAFGASTVLALYINSEQVRLLYARHDFLWGLWFVLIFWLSRLIVLAHRGTVHDDPVVFAATDRTTLVLGVASILFLLTAAL